ncbi:MAG: hypothetical protein ACPGQS_01550 [Bradymonadia bacterium]
MTNRCSGVLALSLVCGLFACGEEGAESGTTAAECVQSDLVAQCPPNTMPELSANSEAICSNSGEVGGSSTADGSEGSGRVENVCAGSGNCQLVCRLINPCDFGVERVSPTDGVICRIPEGGCGDGVCEAGEDPATCPQDCESECTIGSSRCIDGQLQRCAANGLLEEPVDCPASYTCVEAEDGTASCEGGCEPGTARCSDGLLQRCSASGVYESPEACRDEELCREDGDTALCVAAACGDSVIQEGTEDCDDGNNVTEACAYGVESCVVCNSMCIEVPGEVSFCGDNIVQDGEEECDDGDTDTALCPYNETSCTVCDSQCNFVPGEVSSICGDEEIDAENGEACDDGEVSVSAAGSCPNCQPATCGDGFVRRDILDINAEAFEACDDGNAVNVGDGCNADCQLTEEDPLGPRDCVISDSGGIDGMCGPGGGGEMGCEMDGYRCISRVSRETRGEQQGKCEFENRLAFTGEEDGNRVAIVSGTLTTQQEKRDVDIYRYQQRCGYGDDPSWNGSDCTGANQAQYLFVLDFESPRDSDGTFNAADYPSFSPDLVTNTCNGAQNDDEGAWVACKCPDWHPLCAASERMARRYRAFWCVSATEVGAYTVAIGEGIDSGWPSRSIDYTLRVTEMLGVSGCDDYRPPERQALCDRGVTIDQ